MAIPHSNKAGSGTGSGAKLDVRPESVKLSPVDSQRIWKRIEKILDAKEAAMKAKKKKRHHD